MEADGVYGDNAFWVLLYMIVMERVVEIGIVVVDAVTVGTVRIVGGSLCFHLDKEKYIKKPALGLRFIYYLVSIKEGVIGGIKGYQYHWIYDYFLFNL